MRIAKDDIPVKVEAPGAVARQKVDFGDASDFGMIGAEYFSLARGADMAPLLAGLEHDLCHSPHWGYVIAGTIVVDYADGTTDRCVAGDVVHWPAGHTVRADDDAEFVLFSPQDYTPVLDHVARQLDAM